MRITRVETIRSPCRNYCWILAHTDTGLTGVGETYHRADPAEAVIHEFARRCLLGCDPFDIEHIWYAMYHHASYHGLMGAELRAMSGIDMALWDIVAKAVELPLYKVLGGRTRDKVPIYFSGIYDECETSREALQSWSQQCVDNGWKACKTARFFGDFYPRSGCTDFGKVAGYISAADIDEGRRRFEWVRDAVGDRLEVGLDLHASFDVPSAIRIGEAVRDLDPYFIEEPIQPHNVAALKEAAKAPASPSPPASASSPAGASRKYSSSTPPISSTPTWPGPAASPKLKRSPPTPKSTTSRSPPTTTAPSPAWP